MGFIVAAVIGAVLLAVPGSPAYKKPTLGLDLQGGLEVILKAVPNRGQTINPAQMQTAQDIIANRVNEIGVASPNVARQGTDQIVIQLAGIHDPAKAAALIGSTGRLQFFDFEKDLVRADGRLPDCNPTPYPTLYSLLTEQVKAQAKKGIARGVLPLRPEDASVVTHTKVKGKTEDDDEDDAHDETSACALAGPYPTKTQLLPIRRCGSSTPPTAGSNRRARRSSPSPRTPQVVSGTTANFTSATQPVKASPNGTYWYLFKYYPERPNGPPEITGKDLNESNISAGADQNTGAPQVTLGFTGHGGKMFQAITKAEYRPRPARRRSPRLRGHAQPAVRAAQRDRSRRQAPVDAVHRLHRQLALARHRGRLGGHQQHGVDRTRRTSSLSSFRAVRCRTRSTGSRRPRSPRRSARARSTRRSSPRSRASSSSRSSSSCSTASSVSSRWPASRSTRSSTTRRSSSSTSR